jgi:hypothetical protein
MINDNSVSSLSQEEKIINNNQGKYFAEYFYTIGLDEDVIFLDLLYKNDLKKINESIDLRPKVISRMPHFQKTLLNVDDDIVIKVLLIILYLALFS